jgi:acetyl/propionyl-CoA carboxylase alpha subunit
MTIDRLGVIETGENAVRVLNAVGGLNNADTESVITTVLFHRDAELRPWYAREADEVRSLAEAETADDAVTHLIQAAIDTIWIGASSPWDQAELVRSCEAAGIGVVGPNSATLQALAELSRSGSHSLTMAADWTPGGPVRRVEVDVLADDHATVWSLGGRDVSVRRGAETLLAEAPCTAMSDEVASSIRGAATDLVRSVGYRGAAVVTFLHDGNDFALVGVDGVAPPDHATTEERTGSSIIGWRLRVHRGEALPNDEPAGDGVVVEARLALEPSTSDRDAPVSASTPIGVLATRWGQTIRCSRSSAPGVPIEPLRSLVCAGRSNARRW